MTHHTIKTHYTTDDETEIDVTIKFDFSPYAPEVGSTRDHGGLPACDAEVEFISVQFANSGDPALKSKVETWAEAWLIGDGYAEAVCEAVDDLEPPDDDERDRRRDDELTNYPPRKLAA